MYTWHVRLLLVVAVPFTLAIGVWSFYTDIHYENSEETLDSQNTADASVRNANVSTSTESSPVEQSTPEAQVEIPGNFFCNTIAEKTHNEISHSLENLQEQHSPGSCIISIGNNVSFIFSFEDIREKGNGDPKFILNIYTLPKTLVQSLPLDYSWQYDEYSVNLHDDINFDGYRDLLLRVLSPRAAQFSYYIYNPMTNKFEVDEVLSDIFSPIFDPIHKTISATPDIPNYYYDANGDQQYYTSEEQTTVFEFKNGSYVAKVQ
jgi:hypothetical protein